MYGKAAPREPRGDDRGPGRVDNGHKSAKLVITNLHYEVSEKELEVSRIGRGLHPGGTVDRG